MDLLAHVSEGLLGLGALVLLGLVGCAHAPADPAPPPPAAAPALWLEVFPAFPGARQLTSEHVTGNGMHIQWTSWAVAAPPEEVVAFYAKQFPEAEQSGPQRLDVRRKDGKNLGVHPASGSYPKGNGPSPETSERTVIVVSQAIR